MTLRAFGLAGAICAVSAIPALAHHSFAMFDQTQTVEVEGTVKELIWTNPHSWLQIVATDPQGTEKEWSIEMSAPASLMRDGWTMESVAPGDVVTVTLHPIRDGSSAGQFLAILLPNGETISHVYREPENRAPGQAGR
jgi:hypothetical protein